MTHTSVRRASFPGKGGGPQCEIALLRDARRQPGRSLIALASAYEVPGELEQVPSYSHQTVRLGHAVIVVQRAAR
jgi:hypothetical protein